MTILFIGGTGNISAACVRLALARGHRVTLLNRGQRPLAAHGLPELEQIHADLRDEAATARALAGRGFDCVANFIAYDADDVARDLRLFAGRCGQYVFISSASAYRKPPRHPLITEDTPLENPFWEYSRKKIAAEAACLAAHRDHGFPATIVRPSHTYDTVLPLALGGWADFTVIERLRRGRPLVIHGDGSSLWTLTHSDDFARGFLGLLGQPAALGQAFHITSDEWLSWDQIYQTVADAAGAPLRAVHIPTDFLVRFDPGLTGTLRGDKAHGALFDNTKLRRLVPGFRAEIPFAAGIRRTLAWFEADPRRRAVRPETDAWFERLLAAYGHGEPSPVAGP
jgi:nucleoside-diphosphate-sugar epimerase